ncbi:hypothetical protein LJR251_005922 [Rhizobium rhizogenes]|uniref:hypothetical protein n=1 Tax=Rhizobium rhizogenes TaxID=359 RepID=UPI003ECEEB1E
MSELLWIAVPGGTQIGGLPLLRVLIVPKLDGGSLADYGLQHGLPQALADATLEIAFAAAVNDDGNAESSVMEVHPPHIQAQPGIWEAFFAPETMIRQPRRRVRLARDVRVERTSEMAKEVNETFSAAAGARIDTSGQEHPEFDKVIRQQLQSRWGSHASSLLPPPAAAGPFGMRPPDFNQTISLLREHPAVLRALGLIFDVTFTTGLPAGISTGFVRVRVKDSPIPALLPIISPWTQFGRRFLSASEEANISEGMVALDRPENPDDPNGPAFWDVTTVDVANAAGRLGDAARMLAPPGSDPAGTGTVDARPASLPALRSAGLMLMRRGRQDVFLTRLQRSEANAQRQSLDGAVLTADDLVLGYRIDVKREDQNEWFSLHKRTAHYTVKRGGNEFIIGQDAMAEEGHLKAHAAIEDSNGVLRADEIVARWEGWSLALPKPSFASADPQRRDRGNQHLPYDFGMSFALRDKLPHLRFGKSYRMRARVADMVGGGLTADDPAADRCFTKEIAYLRYDPIVSPDLMLPEGADPVGPGEAVDMVVLRSDFDLDAGAFAAENPQYALNTFRLILPPRAALTLAEQHGALDGVSAEESWNWVEQALTGPDHPSLPDFAVAGVAVFARRDPGAPVSREQPRAWTESWPGLKPKHIELRERNGGEDVLSWTEDARLGDKFVVRLAQGEQLTLELSTRPKGDLLDHFAIRGREVGLSSESDKAARAGCHPIVSPKRSVTFVHAVRRPLNMPEGNLEPVREPGQTFAILKPRDERLNIDTQSTGQLDITGTWSEPRDLANDEEPKYEPKIDVPVQSVTINRGDVKLKELRHNFGDTRHRMITYSVTATSRFRRFFADDDRGSFAIKNELPAPVSIPSAARPSPPVVLAIRPAFRWEEDSPGGNVITRRKRFGGSLRIELERPWFLTGEGEQLAVIVWTDANPPEDKWQFLTEAGSNPIFVTNYPDRFPTAKLLDSSFDAQEVFLPEAGSNVVAVPFDVSFSGASCFADISLPGIAASSYLPFVKLALARYQPNSLPGLELSSIVKVEFAELFPERTLTVTGPIRSPDSDAKHVVVKLDGLTQRLDPDAAWVYDTRANIYDVTLELLHGPDSALQSGSLLSMVSTPGDDAGVPAWREVLSTEASSVAYSAGGSSFVGHNVKVKLNPSSGTPIPAGSILRLRIYEYEGLAARRPPWERGVLDNRVVYADIVSLPDM